MKKQSICSTSLRLAMMAFISIATLKAQSNQTSALPAIDLQQTFASINAIYAQQGTLAYVAHGYDGLKDKALLHSHTETPNHVSFSPQSPCLLTFAKDPKGSEYEFVPVDLRKTDPQGFTWLPRSQDVATGAPYPSPPDKDFTTPQELYTVRTPPEVLTVFGPHYGTPLGLVTTIPTANRLRDLYIHAADLCRQNDDASLQAPSPAPTSSLSRPDLQGSGLVPTASAPPPPAGPSLITTLAFIFDKINAVGPVGFWPNVRHMTFNIGNTPSDSCVLLYHFQYHSGALGGDDQPTRVNLRTSHIKSFTVYPGKDAETGEPLIHLGIMDSAGHDVFSFPGLMFHEEDIATRVGKAFVHAGELCSAPKPPGSEPF